MKTILLSLLVSSAFAGLFGSRRPLTGGGEVVADATYIRESILNPKAKVAAGYDPVMPTFKGQLSEGDIAALIAYIKSLSADTSPNGAAGQSDGATSNSAQDPGGVKRGPDVSPRNPRARQPAGPDPSPRSNEEIKR